MNILAIGDVVGSVGCGFLRKVLPSYRKLQGIDLVIANAENSADGNGTTPASAEYLLSSGVDVLTGGNHTFRRRELYDYLETNERILRPANFPASAPGRGCLTVDMGYAQVAVINLMGTVFLENLRCPFETLDEILADPSLPKIKLVDFHAEATGEKRALAFYADGRLSAFFGTHTHVPTADETVLPQGTGYISDLGMTGVIDSALGVKPELVIRKFRSKMPVRFENAKGDCKLDGVVFEIDQATGLCQRAERVSIR